MVYQLQRAWQFGDVAFGLAPTGGTAFLLHFISSRTVDPKKRGSRSRGGAGVATVVSVKLATEHFDHFPRVLHGFASSR